jgi:hypothetical protein
MTSLLPVLKIWDPEEDSPLFEKKPGGSPVFLFKEADA